MAGVTLRPMLAAAAEKRGAVSAVSTSLSLMSGCVWLVALHLQYVVNAQKDTFASLAVTVMWLLLSVAPVRFNRSAVTSQGCSLYAVALCSCHTVLRQWGIENLAPSS